MASKLRPRGSKLDYKLLHNGTFVKLDKRTVSKRTPHVLEETFYVERIIWRKEDSKVCILLYRYMISVSPCKAYEPIAGVISNN